MTAIVRTQSTHHRLSWTLPEGCAGDATDALLAACLLPSMRLNEPLQLSSPASSRLLSGVSAIQDVFVSWSRHIELSKGSRPPFNRVQVQVEARTKANSPTAGGVACFFTAGVDSFYSVLKRRDELTGLIFVHGFDVALGDTERREVVVKAIRQIAAELGIPLFEVETDLKTFSDAYLSWDDYHGAALASVALLMSRWFKRIYVPATMTYSHLLPLGSHPLVDPLWSTEQVELIHDGCEATRLEKVEYIADCEPAMRWLRVCWKAQGAIDYNCGVCEKCLRTMVALRMLGVSDRCLSLPPLTDKQLRQVSRVLPPGSGETWRFYLDVLKTEDRDKALARALRAAVSPGKRKPELKPKPAHRK
jgi:hypothetical protein